MQIDTATLAASIGGIAATLGAVGLLLQRVSLLLTANETTGARHDADVAALRDVCYREGYSAGYLDAARNLGAVDTHVPQLVPTVSAVPRST